MTKRVSADTISKITAAKDFAEAAHVPPPPAVQELIKTIRDALSAGQERVFDQLVNNVPEGFRLVPVFYSKIPGEKNADIQNEYLKRVRDDFLRFLAENHADDLRKIGIAETGIARMKNGLDPADEQGQLYHVSVDHIIERAGSGLWAKSGNKAPDPDRPEKDKQRYRANHFGNLILLPEQIHDYKNTLNKLQDIGTMWTGEGKWVLMMVPERNALYNGFVAPPQHPQHHLHGVKIRPDEPARRIGHLAYLLSRVHELSAELDNDPLMRSALRAMLEISGRRGRSVAEIANEQEKSAAVLAKRPLKDIFNDIVSYDANTKDKIDLFLRPALADIAEYTQDAFRNLSQNLGNPTGVNVYKSFLMFYHGKGMKRLRGLAGQLPLDEALELTRVFAEIDAKIPALPVVLFPAQPDAPAGRADEELPARKKGQRRGQFGRRR